MGYKWKEPEQKNALEGLSDEEKIRLSIQQSAALRISYLSDETTFAEMKGHNPVHYIDKTENWCDLHVAQTYVIAGKNPKNMNLLKKAPRYEELKQVITSEFSDKSFKVGDMVKHFNLQGWTNGDKIRSYLHLMVCEGFLSKNKIEDKKQAHVFEVKNGSQCPFLKLEKKKKSKEALSCSYDWSQSDETSLHWNSEEKEEEDNNL